MLSIVVQMLTLLGVGLLVSVVYLCPLPSIRKHRELITIYVLAISQSCLYWFLFRKTPFGLNAYFGDQHYIIAAIEKFKYFSTYVDFSYAHMASYYPPLYFYILGKIAAWFNISSYTAVKWGFIGAAFILPVVMYYLWRPIIGKGPAVVLTVLLELASFDLFKTYEFTTVVLFLPWWLIFAERRIDSMWKTKRKTAIYLVVGGITGGLIFQTYYYWFMVIAVYMVVRFLWNTMTRVETMREAISDLRHKIFLLVCVAIFSANYWVPVIVQSLTIGYQNFQNKWISPSMLSINFFHQLASFDLLTAVMLVGFVYLVISYKRNATSRIMLQLLLTCYVWYLLGFIGILVGAFNLYVKAWSLNDYVLFVGAALCLGELENWETIKEYGANVSVVVLIVSFLTIGPAAINNLTSSPMYKTSLATLAPPVNIHQLQYVKPLQGSVFLTDQDDAVCFEPIFSFIGSNINYANPAARYMDRYHFVSALSKVQDTRAMAWLLKYNRFDSVDYVWMEGNSLLLSVSTDQFETKYNRVAVNMAYKDSPYFTVVPNTDIYRVNAMPENAYQQFDLYSLAVAFEYGDKSLKDQIKSEFENRIETTNNPNVLRNILQEAEFLPEAKQLIAHRLSQMT